MSSNPCHYMDYRVETVMWQTRAVRGWLVAGQSPWVRAWTEPVFCTLTAVAVCSLWCYISVIALPLHLNWKSKLIFINLLLHHEGYSIMLLNIWIFFTSFCFVIGFDFAAHVDSCWSSESDSSPNNGWHHKSKSAALQRNWVSIRCSVSCVYLCDWNIWT